MPSKRRTLARLAGALWLASGSWLLVLGCIMLERAYREEDATWLALASSAAIGVALGWPKGKYVLGKTARRNLGRFHRLHEPKLWQFLGLRTVLIIVFMASLGRGLRALADAGLLGGHTIIGGLYLGIGVALVRSSRLYFRELPVAPVRAPTVNSAGPTGVLIVNLGAPDSAKTRDVRRYLRQFLSDPLVVEMQRTAWWLMLNLIILPFRSPFAAKLYRKVWKPGGAPILIHGLALRDALREKLGPEYRVALGMRYGNPSLASALDELEAEGCREVTLLSLFPQYSRTTFGTVQAEVFRLLALRRNPPHVRVVTPSPIEPAYIEACATRARESFADEPIDHWVISFRGLPEAYERAGDLYGDHCALTAQAIATKLELAKDQWSLVFQSRFGPEPWLRPYADEFVLDLAPRHKRIAVLLPGFAADCVETLEEIGSDLRDAFLARGGDSMIVVPALNAHPSWVASLTAAVQAPARAANSDTNPAH